MDTELITYLASSQYAGDIEFIRISDCDIDNKEKGIFLESCRIRVDIYRLSEVEVDLRNHLLEESVDLFGRDISESSVSFHGPSQNEHEETQEEPAPQAKVMSLPNRSLVNTWKEYGPYFLRTFKHLFTKIAFSLRTTCSTHYSNLYSIEVSSLPTFSPPSSH